MSMSLARVCVGEGGAGPSGVMFNMHLLLAGELALNWSTGTIGELAFFSVIPHLAPLKATGRPLLCQ